MVSSSILATSGFGPMPPTSSNAKRESSNGSIPQSPTEATSGSSETGEVDFIPPSQFADDQIEYRARQSSHCSRGKRWFTLPRYGRSSAGDWPESAKCSVKEGLKTAEDTVCTQKAAAWQRYTCGVGETVFSTKRPSSATPSENNSGIGNSVKKSEQCTLQKTHLQAPLATASPRVVSCFKAETSSFMGPISGHAHPSPSAATPSTSLYDEFELSGLRTQMANFVQRLQQEHYRDDGQLPAAKVAEKTKSTKSRDLAVTAASSTDHLLMAKGPPAATAEAEGGSAAANSAHHEPTTPISSSLRKNPTIPYSTTPFSALHRLFRKVVSGSVLTCSKTPPIAHNSPTLGATYQPDALACEEGTQYHHHHYIHHHHHYHYFRSPEESVAILHSRRRHSESSCSRPPIPSMLEENSDEEEGDERSPIDAHLARTARRRHSDSFSLHHTSKEADFDGQIRVKVEAEKTVPLRRYSSERFSPNKIQSMEKQDLQAEPAAPGVGDDFQERVLDVHSRRYRADHQNSWPDAGELAGLEKKLGRGGGRIGGGTYKLGGGEEGKTPVVAHVLRRRRHSEGSQRQPEEAARYEMEKSTPSPAGMPYWHSPSTRYLEDMLERRMGNSATANGGSAQFPPRRLSRELLLSY